MDLSIRDRHDAFRPGRTRLDGDDRRLGAERDEDSGPALAALEVLGTKIAHHAIVFAVSGRRQSRMARAVADHSGPSALFRRWARSR
jgi:hypothetical protein